MEKVLIIGGSNIDYIGKCNQDIIPNDSNIGNVKISFGGVGRNICENLAHLKVKPTFITAIGNDEMGQKLASELQSLDVKLLFPPTNLNSASYLAIHEKNGDMVLALCDEAIIEELTLNYLQSLQDYFNEVNYLVLDGNLKEDIIEYIFNHYYDKKIIVDGISTTKVKKFIPYLDKIYLFKTNLYEAQTLVQDTLFGIPLVEALMALNIKQVIVTSGANAIYYNKDSQIIEEPVDKIKQMVNATGAGDAFLAGVIYELLLGLGIDEGIKMGKRLSALTLQVNDAVNKNLDKLLCERN